MSIYRYCLIMICLLVSTPVISQGLTLSPPLAFSLSKPQLHSFTVVKPAIPFKVKKFRPPIKLDFQIPKKTLKKIAGANNPVRSMELQVAAYFYKDLMQIRKFIDKNKNIAYNNMSAEEIEKELTRVHKWLKTIKMSVTHEFITEDFTSLRVILYGKSDEATGGARLSTSLKKVDDFWLMTDVAKHPISILINYKFTAPDDLAKRYDGEVIYKKLSNFVTLPPPPFTNYQLHNPN